MSVQVPCREPVHSLQPRKRGGCSRDHPLVPDMPINTLDLVRADGLDNSCLFPEHLRAAGNGYERRERDLPDDSVSAELPLLPLCRQDQIHRSDRQAGQEHPALFPNFNKRPGKKNLAAVRAGWRHHPCGTLSSSSGTVSVDCEIHRQKSGLPLPYYDQSLSGRHFKI